MDFVEKEKATKKAKAKAKANPIDKKKEEQLKSALRILTQRRKCIDSFRQNIKKNKKNVSKKAPRAATIKKAKESSEEESSEEEMSEKSPEITGNLDYNPRIVFLFYSKSMDKPYPGSGSGESMIAEKKAEYKELSMIPQWRKKLSNFWISEFDLDGHRWASVEHYYQGSKFKEENPDIYLQFSLDSGSELSKDPLLAKSAGGKKGMINGKRTPSVDADFFPLRLNQEMFAAQEAKFTQNAELEALLKATKEAKLMHFTRGKPPVFFENLVRIRSSLS